MMLAEGAALNHCGPNRQYALQFQDIMPHLSRRIRAMVEAGVLGPLAEKVVFPEVERGNFLNAVNAAANLKKGPRNLEGRAIVMGRVMERTFPAQAGTRVEIKLTWMGESRLVFEGSESGNHWNNLVDSFDKVLHPGENPEFETMFIAVVHNDAGTLRAVEAAWARMNRLGILETNRYPYEALVQNELIALNGSFIRGQQEKVRIGKWSQLVDFIVRVKRLGDAKPFWIPLEVDPNGSATKKPSKRRRIAQCEAAGQPAVSHDPKLGLSVSRALQIAGFTVA